MINLMDFMNRIRVEEVIVRSSSTITEVSLFLEVNLTFWWRLEGIMLTVWIHDRYDIHKKKNAITNLYGLNRTLQLAILVPSKAHTIIRLGWSKVSLTSILWNHSMENIKSEPLSISSLAIIIARHSIAMCNQFICLPLGVRLSQWMSSCL